MNKTCKLHMAIFPQATPFECMCNGHKFVAYRYQGIGIRIEDDILITSKGPVVLTQDCPKEIDELESIVGTSVK